MIEDLRSNVACSTIQHWYNRMVTRKGMEFFAKAQMAWPPLFSPPPERDDEDDDRSVLLRGGTHEPLLRRPAVRDPDALDPEVLDEQATRPARA